MEQPCRCIISGKWNFVVVCRSAFAPVLRVVLLAFSHTEIFVCVCVNPHRIFTAGKTSQSLLFLSHAYTGVALTMKSQLFAPEFPRSTAIKFSVQLFNFMAKVKNQICRNRSFF